MKDQWKQGWLEVERKASIHGWDFSYIEGKYITTEESLERLCRLLPESDIIKNSVIVFDGFTGFTPVQNSVIEKLLLLAEEVIITISIDKRAPGSRLKTCKCKC